MKKLLVLFALLTITLLGAQDVSQRFYAGTAPGPSTMHFFTGPDGNPAPDGWAIAFVIDVAADGINGLDLETRTPLDDDVFTLNNNINMDALNGATVVGQAGTWAASSFLILEAPSGSPDEPVVNTGDVIYFVLFNNADPALATHYCTNTNTIVTETTGGPYMTGVAEWNDTAWIAFGGGGPTFNDATDPVPADGSANVRKDIGMLEFTYDDAGADVPAEFQVMFGSENPPMTIHEVIPYTGAGVYYVNVPDPLLDNDTYFWSVLPSEGSVLATQEKVTQNKREQTIATREPAVWSFTTEGETVGQVVPGGGGNVQFAFGDGVTIDVSGVAVGGNLDIIEYSTPPADLPIPANCLPLWFDIDPTGVWTEFPVNIVITWNTPVPEGDAFELVWFNGSEWVPFVDPADGVINGYNLTAAPYWVDFSAAHFTQYAMSKGAGTTLPVTFSSFAGEYQAEFDQVMLTWTTESEVEMVGYNVLRSQTNDVATAVYVNQNIIEALNASSTTNYSHLDNQEIEANSSYYYWIEAIENTGVTIMHGSITVNTDETEVPSVESTLLQSAYPNPFNPTTNIKYSVKPGENGTLTIFNVLGQVVKTYTVAGGDNGVEDVIQWHGVDNNGKNVGSGIYFYKLETQSYSKINKMLLLK